MHQRIPIRLFSATSSSLKIIPGSRNLLHLVEGVYNPPLSMSKSTAKKWAKVAPMKSALIPRTDIKQVAVEKSFILKEQDEGKSLEQVTSAYFGLDPPSARLKILNGEIWLKGSLHAKYADNLRPKQVVHFGDVLAGAIHKPASKDQINRKLDELKKELKENVIFKDKDIIIINKPSNLVTHTGSKHNAINIEALLDIMKTDSDQETPRLVHRLDKDTTGCLILARHKEAATRLSNLFQTSDAITKKYLAMIIPPLSKETYKAGETVTITSGLVMHGEHRNQRMKVVPWNEAFQGDSFRDVQKAVTKITILKSTKLSTLACLEPITGRKHQLRAHVASLDSFLLGDYKYGIGCTKQFAHQVSNPLKVPLHLHFWRVTIPHWFGEGKHLDVVAPLPEIWKKSITSTGHSMENAEQILNL